MRSLGARFLQVLERVKALTIPKKDKFGNLLVPIMDFVIRQHSWLYLLHGKASLMREQSSEGETLASVVHYAFPEMSVDYHSASLKRRWDRNLLRVPELFRCTS